MPAPHNIDIVGANPADEARNALAWGGLVFSWINQPVTRPRTVQELRTQMAANNVLGNVRGNGDRPVTVFPYTGTGIIIPIPTAQMIDDDRRELIRIAGLPVGERHYPVPAWYSDIFGGAAKVDLSQQDLFKMALRRLGEYVVNECM